MGTTRGLYLGVVVVGVGAFLLASQGGVRALPQSANQSVNIDNDDIGGIVTGPRAPRPASGSSPKRATCRPGSSRSWSPTIRAAT